MAYKALRNVMVNGEVKESGSVFELDSETAERLIAKGSIESTDSKPEVPTETKEVETPTDPLSDSAADSLPNPSTPLTESPHPSTAEKLPNQNPAPAGPSDKTTEQAAQPQENQPSTPTPPVSSEPTSPNLHLG